MVTAAAASTTARTHGLVQAAVTLAVMHEVELIRERDAIHAVLGAAAVRGAPVEMELRKDVTASEAAVTGVSLAECPVLATLMD